MKIKLKRTEEQTALLEAMASSDLQKSLEAQSVASEFIEPVLQQVVNTAATMSALFETLSFNEDDNPSLPLDLYHDITDVDYIQVVMQHSPGGLATNAVMPATRELKFATYPLESAYSFDKKHARRHRLDLLGATFTRMAQEFLFKREIAAANNILNTLALAAAESTSHMIDSNFAQRLSPADFNDLIVKSQRINASWTDGTPSIGSRGVTDLIVSPERMADLREMAYNPINTQGANGTAGTNASGTVTLPDSARAELFSAAGMASFYGLNLIQIYELGVGQRYTNLFRTLAAAQSVTFNAADDLVLGIDRARGGAYRAVMLNGRGSEVSVMPDDQFVSRQKKIGFYAEMEEGLMTVDRRFVTAIRIKGS